MKANKNDPKPYLSSSTSNIVHSYSFDDLRIQDAPKVPITIVDYSNSHDYLNNFLDTGVSTSNNKYSHLLHDGDECRKSGTSNHDLISFSREASVSSLSLASTSTLVPDHSTSKYDTLSSSMDSKIDARSFVSSVNLDSNRDDMTPSLLEDKSDLNRIKKESVRLDEEGVIYNPRDYVALTATSPSLKRLSSERDISTFPIDGPIDNDSNSFMEAQDFEDSNDQIYGKMIPSSRSLMDARSIKSSASRRSVWSSFKKRISQSMKSISGKEVLSPMSKFYKRFPFVLKDPDLKYFTFYRCTIGKKLNYKGKLYVTSKGLFFYGKLLTGTVIRACLSFNDIIHMEKNESMDSVSSSRSIKISTIQKQYLFKGFRERNSAFAVISDSWQSSLQDSVKQDKSRMKIVAADISDAATVSSTRSYPYKNVRTLFEDSHSDRKSMTLDRWKTLNIRDSGVAPLAYPLISRGSSQSLRVSKGRRDFDSSLTHSKSFKDFSRVPLLRRYSIEEAQKSTLPVITETPLSDTSAANIFPSNENVLGAIDESSPDFRNDSFNLNFVDSTKNLIGTHFPSLHEPDVSRYPSPLQKIMEIDETGFRYKLLDLSIPHSINQVSNMLFDNDYPSPDIGHIWREWFNLQGLKILALEPWIDYYDDIGFSQRRRIWVVLNLNNLKEKEPNLKKKKQFSHSVEWEAIYGQSDKILIIITEWCFPDRKNDETSHTISKDVVMSWIFPCSQIFDQSNFEEEGPYRNGHLTSLYDKFSSFSTFRSVKNYPTDAANFSILQPMHVSFFYRLTSEESNVTKLSCTCKVTFPTLESSSSLKIKMEKEEIRMVEIWFSAHRDLSLILLHHMDNKSQWSYRVMKQLRTNFLFRTSFFEYATPKSKKRNTETVARSNTVIFLNNLWKKIKSNILSLYFQLLLIYYRSQSSTSFIENLFYKKSISGRITWKMSFIFFFISFLFLSVAFLLTVSQFSQNQPYLSSGKHQNQKESNWIRQIFKRNNKYIKEMNSKLHEIQNKEFDELEKMKEQFQDSEKFLKKIVRLE